MQHFKETIQLLEKSSFYYTIALGMDGNYIYVSPNYDRNFDFLKDSLLGKPFYITLHADDIKICEEVGMKCFQNPEQLHPATLRKHDGKGGYVITQWELKALMDEQNNPCGIFCIGYNITDYVTTQHQLQHAETEIEHKTDQLNEIGFMQAHVIRKPLANIMGLVNVLDNMEVDANLNTVKTLILDSAIELDGVIKQIIDKV